MTSGFTLKLAGDLKFGPLTISGEFKLTITSSSVEMVVNASMTLGVLGSISLKDSGFRINSQGLVARFAPSLGLFGGSFGLTLSVSAVVEINTTGRAQTFNNTTIAAGFRLALNGEVTFLNFASAKGSLDITISDGTFLMAASLEFEIGPLVFKVAGSLGIYSNGLTATLDVTLDLDLLGGLLSLEMSGKLRLDTRHGLAVLPPGDLRQAEHPQRPHRSAARSSSRSRTRRGRSRSRPRTSWA